MTNWSGKSVSETLKALVESLVGHGKDILPDYNPEVIHKFRVETKKLRALLRLIETQDADAVVKLSKRFKKLYSLSGAIRDAQVLLARATTEADPPLPDYTVWLAQEMANAQTEMEAFYDEKILDKLSSRAEKAELPEISFETLKSFFTSRLEEIQSILTSDPLEDEDLHTVRKRVKDLQHIAKICSDSWPEGLEGLDEVASLDALEIVTDRAGDYNDQSVALISIERYLEVAEKPKKTTKVRDAWSCLKAENLGKLLQTITDFRAGKLRKEEKPKANHSSKSADAS